MRYEWSIIVITNQEHYLADFQTVKPVEMMGAIIFLDKLNEERKSTSLRSDNFDIREKNVYKKFYELVEEENEHQEDSDVGDL